ncbi:MAG: exodeoxyribonuclease VII large subunit [Bacteroidaceae bacterium]|nr:exodeoxyribonuclease VII large subunit [Bacteroidaceae bacterium]
MEALTLYELNHLVRQTLELTLDDEYWVRTEVSELHVNRHCYMEFVQKDTHGNGLIAKARAQVWANRWAFIKPMFEQITGQTLSAGMQVLVKVQATFHELYGYSLNVTDLDPTYTLGDIARRRQEILQQLRDEGVETMNKELPLPRLLQRIAVISSATAAGYGDFCNQLHGNKRGLAFKTELFQATMQGNEVESSVIAALNQIARRMDEWDVVVIIRGGGSTSDLSGFDSLALAENVAQFPLPIITGIGHERDDTVIDLIAHTRVKTPTAAAELLIHHQEEEMDLLEDFAARLASTTTILERHRNMVERLATRLGNTLTIIERHRNVVERMTARLANTMHILEGQRNAVELMRQRMTLHVPLLMDNKKKHIQLIESQLESASPDRILRLGFSIARINGKAIHHAADVKEGDEIETTLATGTLKSTVTWKKI